MRRCSSGRGGMVGVCSCGMYHSQSSPFCVVLSMSNGGQYCSRGFDEEDDGVMTTPSYGFNTVPSAASSSVDCTLSLGTPSTRLANPDENAPRRSSSSSCVSGYFGWNILPTSSKHAPPHPAAKAPRNCSGGGDPLLARRCANCDTTSTPLWRNGPRGPKSLCNACGIRFKKEERRATAAAGAGDAHASNWVNPPQKAPEPDNGGIPSFLSWHFNVSDRPGLVHGFTR